MEGGRDVAAGAAEVRRWRRSGEESDGSIGGGGVELSLRLRTGDSSAPPQPPPPAMAAVEEERRQRQQQQPVAAEEARRSMTIFYNGRVCAVDVTEVQARAIISMANKEMVMAAAAAAAAGQHHRQQCHQRERHLQDSGSSSSSANAMARPASDVPALRPAAAAAAASPAAAGSSRQGFAAVAAPPVMDHAASGLSMKRSLQRFLQKRKARTGGDAPPPYAGGLHAQAQAMRH